MEYKFFKAEQLQKINSQELWQKLKYNFHVFILPLQNENWQTMEDYSLLVSGLEYKVRQLIEMINSQSAEILEMKELIGSLQTDKQRLQEQLDEMTRQKQILEIAGVVENAKDPGKLRLKINEYIREIDKCIAYFNAR